MAFYELSGAQTATEAWVGVALFGSDRVAVYYYLAVDDRVQVED